MIGGQPPNPRDVSDPKKQRVRAAITDLIEAEMAGCSDAVALADFRAHLRPPREVAVNFSGGITQRCRSVTRTNGEYRVIYLPTAGYFSLCVESDFGPLDIGVHGPTLGCFGSV